MSEREEEAKVNNCIKHIVISYLMGSMLYFSSALSKAQT
jgi:hypothetical protein